MRLEEYQLSRRPGLPLYLQLEELLARYIETPEARSLGFLPRECELCAMFQVSRNTVSQALAMLAKKNLVRRIRHRGTMLVTSLEHCDPRAPRKSIGLVFPVSSSWNAALAAIEEESRIHGYSLEIYSYVWQELDDECRALERARRNCAGMILHPNAVGSDREVVRELNEAQVPLVLFDVGFDDLDCNTVTTNGITGAFRLVEYLVKSGCHRIAGCAWLSHLCSVRRRIEGFHRAMAQAGLTAVDFMEVDFEAPAAVRIARLRQLLATKPDGIFLTFQWRDLLPELERAGMREVRIANFDRMPSDGGDFDILTAEVPKEMIGTTAVRMLCRHIKGPGLLHEQTLLSPRFLVQKHGVLQMGQKSNNKQGKEG